MVKLFAKCVCANPPLRKLLGPPSLLPLPEQLIKNILSQDLYPINLRCPSPPLCPLLPNVVLRRGSSRFCLVGRREHSNHRRDLWHSYEHLGQDRASQHGRHEVDDRVQHREYDQPGHQAIRWTGGGGEALRGAKR